MQANIKEGLIALLWRVVGETSLRQWMGNLSFVSLLCLGKQALPLLASSVLLPRREMSPASGWLRPLLQDGQAARARQRGGGRGAARALVFSLTLCSLVAQKVPLSSNGRYSGLGLCRKFMFLGKM